MVSTSFLLAASINSFSASSTRHITNYILIYLFITPSHGLFCCYLGSHTDGMSKEMLDKYRLSALVSLQYSHISLLSKLLSVSLSECWFVMKSVKPFTFSRFIHLRGSKSSLLGRCLLTISLRPEEVLSMMLLSGFAAVVQDGVRRNKFY